MPEFTLYSYFRSSASMRVRIALNLKKIEYQYRAVHLTKDGGEQFAAEYARLNPSREVPTLVHNGRAIGQSVAIIDYLERIRPEPRLFPRDPYLHAVALQACEIINSGSQPIHNHRVDHELERVFGANKQHIHDWTAYWIKYGLDTLEEFLRPYAGEYCIGNEISAADCFLIPHLSNARRFKLDLERYPKLMRAARACESQDAFKQAAMGAQPDTPPDQKTSL